MVWRILHRMIFAELAKIFILSLLGITGILVMAGLVAEASQQGLNPSQILGAIPLLVPSTLPYTIPATTLFATCVVYGRLAHDSEILAIKAAGINVLHVVWPGVGLGLLMSCATMALYYDVIPRTHQMLRDRILDDVEEFMYAMLKKDGCLKIPGQNYIMAVRQVQKKRLLGAIFQRRDANGNTDMIAQAREADLRVDREHKQIIVHMRYGTVTANGKDTIHFVDKEWPVDFPATVVRKPRPRGMTWQQLVDEKRELQDKLEDTTAQLGMELSRSLMQNAPINIHQHIKNLEEIKKRLALDIRCADAEMNMRPALAFGCLFFVLVGCPVGIWFSRSDYLSAFITCFLPVVFIYYPMLLCTNNLAKEGKLPAVVALWLANGVMALAAPPMFWKLMKN